MKAMWYIGLKESNKHAPRWYQVSYVKYSIL